MTSGHPGCVVTVSVFYLPFFLFTWLNKWSKINVITFSLGSTDHKLSLCHSRYNQASEVNERGHYVPLCESDGSYKQIQCNSATDECWCVDRGGKEKPETRKIGQPSCESKGMFIWSFFSKTKHV